jgi:hypothetical protein
MEKVLFFYEETSESTETVKARNKAFHSIEKI